MNKFSSLLMGIISSTFLLSSLAYADDKVYVSEPVEQYYSVNVKVPEVRGVQLKLVLDSEVVCEDDQKFHADLRPVWTGTPPGLNMYIVSAVLSSEFFNKCQSGKKSVQRLESEVMTVPSFRITRTSGGYGEVGLPNGKIDIWLMIPKRFKLEATELLEEVR